MAYREKLTDVWDFKKHSQNKGMWIGASSLTEIETYIMTDGQFIKQKVECSPALLKCFDELLVNAVDHYFECIDAPALVGGSVRSIFVSLDKSCGEISIMNTGPGFPCVMDRTIKTKYMTEVSFTREFSGSNLNDKVNKFRVTGGTNGVGVKAVNANAHKMSIETVDSKRRKYYFQTYEDSFNKISEPRVVDLRDKSLNSTQKSPHTTIKFMPNYDLLCEIDKGTPYSKDGKSWEKFAEHMDLLEKMLEFRTWQIAAFISSVGYRYTDSRKISYPSKERATVYFQGREIPVHSLNDFASKFGIQTTSITLSGPGIKFPWYICVGSSFRPNNISLINGILVSKGSHINILINMIVDSLEPHIKKTYKKRQPKAVKDIIKRLLFVVNCKQIPVKSFDFDSQTKDSMTINRTELNRMKKAFKITPADATKIWNLVKDLLALELLNKNSKVAQNKTRIRKYEKAKWAGGKNRHLATLMIFEGDSAAGLGANIINSPKTSLDPNAWGMYNLQGVPMNVCKQVKPIRVGGKLRYNQTPNLQKNIALQGLRTILGLDYMKDYTVGDPQGDADYAQLNYGGVVLCTDQDLDGIGQICSLAMAFFAKFWPALFERGFVRRLQTPIIRVYTSSSQAIPFYSEAEYDKWVIDNFGHVDNMPKSHVVKYYKGLAGHNDDEVIYDIGARFTRQIYTYLWDPEAAQCLEDVHGRSTTRRKEILAKPILNVYDPDLWRQNKIKCSTHWKVETPIAQQDNMRRKLRCAIDGFIPSQRKAFAGARKAFGATNKELFVYQLTGKVAASMAYHHGSDSMDGAIIKMAQAFTGAHNLPVFLPLSDFGSRRAGRAVSGSPRYIRTKMNKRLTDLLFPPEDDWLLDYVDEDGERAEPKYYVPVLPYAILEHEKTVGTGWNIQVLARDISWVAYNLRQMIKYNYPADIGKPYSLKSHAWISGEMDLYTKGRSEICLGNWYYDAAQNAIIITELPMRVWSSKLKCKLLGINFKTGKTTKMSGGKEVSLPRKEYIKDISDHTGNDKVHMIIELRAGAYEKIMEQYGKNDLHPIVDYLGLKNDFYPLLNMITADGIVREFDAYEDVMEYWFLERKKLYQTRLERNVVLKEYKIRYWKNILRFIEMDRDEKINIDGLDLERRSAILASESFQKFNKTNLLSPRYLRKDELYNAIFVRGANYKYIDEITVGQKSGPAIQRLKDKIASLEAEFAEYKDLTWSAVWTSELDQLIKVISEGRRTNWKFTDKKVVFSAS